MPLALLLVAALAPSAAARCAEPAAQQPTPPSSRPAPALAAPAAQLTPADRDFAAAQALRAQNKYSAAADAFEAWLARYPENPRWPEARVQAGVASFEHARSFQADHRNPPAGVEAFARALGHFEDVLRRAPGHAVAGRAQYMSGSTLLFLGDLESSEIAYDQVLARYAGDAQYAPKALLRRADLRVHLLRPADALLDYRAWKGKYARGDGDKEALKELAKVDLAIEYASQCGQPVPELDVSDWIQGEPTTLAALRGKALALFFFEPSCDRCPLEIPFLHALQQRYAARGLVLLAIAGRGKGATAEATRKYAAEHALRYPVALDREQTFDRFHAQLVPNLMLVDAQGRVRWHEHPGNLADWTIEQLLPAPAATQPAR